MALQDGFLDPDHQVIYNKLGITDQALLSQKEGIISVPAMLRIVTGLVELPGSFDAAHIRRIHHETFKDVYPWAGRTRAEGPHGPFQGQKPTTVRGTPDVMRYGPYQQLDQRLDAIGAQLGLENNLCGLSPAQFAQRAAYYFDQYNHTHAFREGNGRTAQGILAVLGRQAGYQVEIPRELADKLNPVRDLAIVRPYGPDQPARNLEALALLLANSIQPLSGPEAAALRDPSQARPLAEPTPAMQRIEAQRVMQSAAFVVGAALRDIDRGDTRRGNELVQQMNRVLLGEATAAQLGPQLQKAALEVSKHPILGKEAEATSNAVWLARSVQQLVKLEQAGPVHTQRHVLPELKAKPELKPETPKPVKRRGAKL